LERTDPQVAEETEKQMSRKLTDGVKLMDFKVQDSNCRDPRGTGKCQYGGVCRVLIVIYKITCKMTNTIYIRNTQQNFKKQKRCEETYGERNPLGLLRKILC
jgi:hypothetical protein